MTEPKLQDSPPAQQGERLPCRGCQASCPHYQSCDDRQACGGTSWRMAADVAVPAQ